jgi:hypothetical protein
MSAKGHALVGGALARMVLKGGWLKKQGLKKSGRGD